MIFEQELTDLRESLEEMTKYVEESVYKLRLAVENGDHETAEQIVKDDKNVNDMERSIEAKCLALITKQQPIARDLRLISSVLKVVTDIERIGDHVADIALISLRYEKVRLADISGHIMPMIQAAGEMVAESVDSFVRVDRKSAEEVIRKDDIVDELFNKVKYDVIEDLKTASEDVDQCIDVLMIAKYLERIGDHATNIAEWEVFKETGTIDNVRLL